MQWWVLHVVLVSFSLWSLFPFDTRRFPLLPLGKILFNLNLKMYFRDKKTATNSALLLKKHVLEKL